MRLDVSDEQDSHRRYRERDQRQSDSEENLVVG